MHHVHSQRPLLGGHRGAQRTRRVRRDVLGLQLLGQWPDHAPQDVDRPGGGQRELAPQPDRALHGVVRVRLRQLLLVRAPGLVGQLLERQQIRAGGGQVTGGAGRITVLGGHVVADHREIAGLVGLVAEQPAEEVQPQGDRQEQRDDGGGGAAPQRPGKQYREEQAEPRQEGLHQTAQTGQVRELPVKQQKQAEQQRTRGEDRAALPRARRGAARRLSSFVVGRQAALSGLRCVHLCHRLLSLTLAHR